MGAHKSPHLRGGDLEGGVTAEERILALKVCDPACGSGHFLIAAANRMAKALAAVRTGEEEPPPAAIQEAKRDIIGHCIYGVDINPMAVELCKVNLWMEALKPGKPLNFLDHRILVGNSLLGTTPRLMAAGIPDDAFNPLEGDDPKAAAAMKKRNREERGQREADVFQHGLWDDTPATDYGHLTDAMHALDGTPDDTLEGVLRKEAQYAALARDPEYVKARLLADAWCAAFVWEKKPSKAPTPGPSPSGGGETAGSDEVLPHEGEGRQDSPALKSPHLRGGDLEGGLIMPLTDLLYRRMEKDPLADNLQAVREYVVELADRYQFFHWHVAFPDVFSVGDSPHPPTPSPSGSRGENSGMIEQVPPPEGEGFRVGAFNPQTGWHGGFDVVLGNPPWEHTEIKEKEWFAERVPEIAAAPGAKRKKLIEQLAEHDPYLYQAFVEDKRAADGFSHFVRTSGNYALTGRGRINTYPLFAETSRHVINGYGRVGMIVPSGIATDDTTKYFFQDLMQTRSLASLYDFENRDAIFPGVHRSYKFSLVTMRGSAPTPGPSPSGRGEQERGSKVLPHEGEGFRMGARRGAEFVFFAHSVADLKDDWRRFTLSAEDIAALNPNTGTMATFRSVRDAEITKAIYGRVPVLIRETPTPDPSPSGRGEQVSPPEGGRHRGWAGEGNPWGITFKQGLFNMTSDSHLFRTREELEAAGFTLVGNHFVGPHSPGPSLPQGERGANRAASPHPPAPSPSGSRGANRAASPHPPAPSPSGSRGEIRGMAEQVPPPEGEGFRVGAERYLPLYEGRLGHQYNHRFAVQPSGEMREVTLGEVQNPNFVVEPQFFVSNLDFDERTQRRQVD